MGVTHGDSGGGWFANIDGQMQLIGISAQESFLVESIAIRPAAYADWINAKISPVPEPSSMVLFTTAGFFVSLRRSRAKRGT